MFTRLFSRTTPTKKSEVEELPDTPPDLSSDSDDSSQSDPQGTPFSQLYTEAAEFEKVLLHSGCIDPLGVCPKGTTGFADLVGHDLSKCERALLDRDAQLHAVEAPWFLPESDDESQTSTEVHEPTPEDFTLSHITLPDIHRVSSVDNKCLTHLEPKDIVNILIKEFGPVAAPGDEERLLLEADGCLIHDIAVVVSFMVHIITFKSNQSIGSYSPHNSPSSLSRVPARQPSGSGFFQ
jgi:sterol 3beta-glucosyltransferase